MLIFDDIPRPDTNVPEQHEAAFAYLNRSGRPEAARVRQLAEDWLTHYPADHRDALIARLRSTIDDQHRAAFFELFIHELLLAREHRILAIEPKLPHTPKSPDFLVEAKEGHRLYIECVLATGRSQQEVAAQARLNQALTAIDRTSSPRHFLDLTVHGVPTAPISINAMTKALRAWITGLPDDDDAMDAAPFQHQEHGATISLRAFPRRHPERARRAIGARFFPAGLVTVPDDVRGALEKKASRYGALDQPYVVAVNALGMFAREDAAIDALLGSPCMVLEQTADGLASREGRNPDGVWSGPSGARRKGLSAVLSTERIDPWNFAVRRGRLIRNPWTTAPVPPFDLGVDDFQPEKGRYRIAAGQSMGEILGLPDGWPEA
ncbi:hypothetical protein GCM10011611_61090 [Aliidongia dinghuensis]|uniref:Uncharacterized protein n=1 Tax=Aliidongia dinghuensis TaxID=1867774 RepID=A0A8J2Z0X8_9PROT|nr:hypothetical protein [Aliidongia dinghuensis]GGF46408.1 hypothetical protein GCM10011611_61090 [Aliidongia dinghuensis]